MASRGNERRMVFDIRGRRRYAVKVVYAVLAVLMAASLFLVVGPLNIGELFNGEGGGGEVAKPALERAERLERKLRKQPGSEDLLLSLTRAQVTAANGLAGVSATGQREITQESIEELQKASESWSKYLKAAKEPSAGLAQIMAPAFFSLAEASGGNEIEPNLQAAVRAQEIVAKQRPNLNSLSTLGVFKMFTFEYKAAEKAGKEAKKYATTKFERENIDNQLKETRKRAEKFQSQLVSYEKALKSSKGKGKAESIENPFGELGGSGLSGSGGFGG